MKERYRMYCRAGGNYFIKDKITGKRESLRTDDCGAARHILVARNQAAEQPHMNRILAKAYLSGKSPELLVVGQFELMRLDFVSLVSFGVTSASAPEIIRSTAKFSSAAFLNHSDK